MSEGIFLPKGRELVGLPVISLQAGEELGRVQDLVWEKTNFNLLGVLLSPHGLFKGPQFVEFKKIKGHGPDALTVDSKTSLRTPLPKGSLRWRDFRGRRVLDPQGKELGLLEDFEVEWPSGRIIGLELSAGLVDDFLEGRHTVNISNLSITWGPDVVILR